MALPPNARAKRGNASKYCCGSGHAHRQGGSQLKAKVSDAKHRSQSGVLAFRMNGSGIIWYCPLGSVSFVARALLANGHGPRSRPSIHLVLCLNATIFTNTKNRKKLQLKLMNPSGVAYRRGQSSFMTADRTRFHSTR